jgi:hypothetical protein
MYFPQNWELGSAFKNFGIFLGGGGVEPPIAAHFAELYLNVKTTCKPALLHFRNVKFLKASISTVRIMLFHSKLLKGKAILAAKTDQVYTRKIVDTGVEISTAGQLHLVTLTFWHRNLTFKFSHTLYVKCEKYRNQKS